MRTPSVTPLDLLAVLAPALMAGFFYAFSVCVMAGLGDSGPTIAVAAMQGINRAVRNPLFLITYLAPPIVAALAAWRAWRGGQRSAGLLFLLAGLLYAGGVLAPTSAVNVPMNDALAALEPGVGHLADAWQAYQRDWTRWNTVRTLVSLAAAGLALLASGWRRLPRHEPA